MNSPQLTRATAACASAFLAGAVNSVAGGGTLLSFPTLIWLGLDSVTANATSTVAIWPGTLGSIWGYRRELAAAEPRFRVLIVPSLLGGLLGALLLRLTPPSAFDHVVPFLILSATLLLIAREPVQHLFKTDNPEARRSGGWLAGAIVFQFGVGVYGGYFGAGIGILMLAALGILGLTDIHEMNSLKVMFGGAVNGIAAVYFVWAGMVDWPYLLMMALGSLAGGYAGAGLAKKVGRTAVRRFVIAVGFGLTIWLFARVW